MHFYHLNLFYLLHAIALDVKFFVIFFVEISYLKKVFFLLKKKM